MKKNNILVVIDKVVWWIVALFPLFVLLFNVINNNILSLSEVLVNLGVPVSTGNVIYTALFDLFHVDGNFLKVFGSADFIAYATYFVIINLVHLVIDLMLVLVDWCHNALKGVFRKW